ncbi:hypothetical protein NOVO_03100 [Rickettsiales bacterium Ac37b]|nr:hypothetical protein NOVO_03100 [Rickettsiales bacterium Ac37b]
MYRLESKTTFEQLNYLYVGSALFIIALDTLSLICFILHLINLKNTSYDNKYLKISKTLYLEWVYLYVIIVRNNVFIGQPIFDRECSMARQKGQGCGQFAQWELAGIFLFSVTLYKIIIAIITIIIKICKRINKN